VLVKRAMPDEKMATTKPARIRTRSTGETGLFVHAGVLRKFIEDRRLD
jgi:hypothetical protein